MKHIAVVGSLNMDFVVAVERLPAPGETVLGRDFQMLPGGKGANQACAAGKLGAGSVVIKMVGRVGQDVFGDALKASLAAAGVDVTAVGGSAEPTGVALIAVERSGQNSIVVAAGANHALRVGDVEAMRPVLRGAGFVLLQLETPLDTVEAVLRMAHQEGVRTILDPAPAQPLSQELLSEIDILTPNETEASILLGREAGRVSLSDAPALAAELLGRGPKSVLLKLGEQGCFFSDGVMQVASPAFAVSAVDTTAAGDTFNAALAVALSEGTNMPDSLRFANAAAALSVTRSGAQASIPSRADVDRFVE